MTREETKRLLKEIEQLYPESFQRVDPMMVLGLWTEALENEKYDDVHKCLVHFVKEDTRGYAPKVGQLLAYKAQPYDDRGLKDWGVWSE